MMAGPALQTAGHSPGPRARGGKSCGQVCWKGAPWEGEAPNCDSI